MEVTDPRIPGLSYPGIIPGYPGSELSWDKPVEVATEPRVPGLTYPRVTGLSYPGISQV